MKNLDYCINFRASLANCDSILMNDPEFYVAHVSKNYLMLIYVDHLLTSNTEHRNRHNDINDIIIFYFMYT